MAPITTRWASFNGFRKYADYPHAKIKSINIANAKSLDGVRAVLTHENILARNLLGRLPPIRWLCVPIPYDLWEMLLP
jgi:CO/xanthine dehydrogenase Mo-binding subunit